MNEATKLKQVEEIQRILEAEINGSYARMDGRIGYALSTLGVTERDYGWGSTRYKLNTMTNGCLTPKASAWMNDHGLDELAAKFNTIKLRNYVDERVGRLQNNRARLMEQIAGIDADIAKLNAMLQQETQS